MTLATSQNLISMGLFHDHVPAFHHGDHCHRCVSAPQGKTHSDHSQVTEAKGHSLNHTSFHRQDANNPQRSCCDQREPGGRAALALPIFLLDSTSHTLNLPRLQSVRKRCLQTSLRSDRGPLTLTSCWGKGPREFSGTLMGGMTQSRFCLLSPLELWCWGHGSSVSFGG